MRNCKNACRASFEKSKRSLVSQSKNYFLTSANDSEVAHACVKRKSILEWSNDKFDSVGSLKAISKILTDSTSLLNAEPANAGA